MDGHEQDRLSGDSYESAQQHEDELLEMEDQPLEQDEEHEGERRLHQRENERQAVRGLSEICSLLV